MKNEIKMNFPHIVCLPLIRSSSPSIFAAIKSYHHHQSQRRNVITQRDNVRSAIWKYPRIPKTKGAFVRETPRTSSLHRVYSCADFLSVFYFSPAGFPRDNEEGSRNEGRPHCACGRTIGETDAPELRQLPGWIFLSLVSRAFVRDLALGGHYTNRPPPGSAEIYCCSTDSGSDFAHGKSRRISASDSPTLPSESRLLLSTKSHTHEWLLLLEISRHFYCLFLFARMEKKDNVRKILK